MRRKDREVSDIEKIDEIIKSCKVLRLGFYDKESNDVYIVPLNFGFCIEDGKHVFYFHSAKQGRKIDLINSYGRACFEMDINHKTIGGEFADDYTTLYQSVVGNGKVSIVEDCNGKLRALQALMLNVSGKGDWEITKKMIDSVCIFKLIVENITCKQNLG